MHSLQMLRVSYKNHHTFSSVLTVTIVVHVLFLVLLFLVPIHIIVLSGSFFSTRLFGSKAIVCSDNMFKTQHAPSLELESLVIPFLSMPTYSKSLYVSRVVCNFYGTEIEILAGFGPVGNTEKKLGRL